MKILSHPSEKSIEFVVDFMHFVEGCEGMEGSMSPVEEKVLDEIDEDDLPDDFTKGRKVMEPDPQSIFIDEDEQRIHYEVI